MKPTANFLTPVTLSGFVAPQNKGLDKGHKLISYSGLEYFIDADFEWRDILSLYCWEEVKIVGFLNVSSMTLIPQKVYPKGPIGQKESAIDVVAWKGKSLARKLIHKVNDLVLVPATASAVEAM